MSQIIDPSRRKIIKLGLITAGLSLYKPAFSLSHNIGHKHVHTDKMKELAFYNLHTDEKLRVTYFKNGEYDKVAMNKIYHILRDFRTGDVYPISANLIDLMHDLQDKLKTDKTIEIISGYRSKKTNDMLAKRSHSVAKGSYHTKGLATDLRMSGISTRKIKMTALFMKRGGVGYYPKSNFVHVDVGPVRHWGA